MHLCHCVDVSILHWWMRKCVNVFAYIVKMVLVCKAVWIRASCLFGPPGWFVQLVGSCSWLDSSTLLGLSTWSLLCCVNFKCVDV